MCTKGDMSPLPIKLAKITVILIFFCFAECAAGSCLSYGHACWGGHGKRSGPRNTIFNIPNNKNLASTRWYLSRLLQNPLDLRYLSSRDYKVPSASQHTIEQQLFNDINTDDDTIKGREQTEINIPDLLTEDENSSNSNDELIPGRRTNLNKIRGRNFLKKRSIKMN